MTPNGRSVARRISRICERSAAGSVHDAPSEPIPPASDTAAARAGVAAGPIGACITGTRHGSRLVGRGSHYAFSTAPASGHLAASSARLRTPSFR